MTEWVFAPGTPPTIGWYATLYCWEIDEGVHAGAAYWDGSKWQSLLPIVSWSSLPLADEQTATEWARENDPERPAHPQK